MTRPYRRSQALQARRRAEAEELAALHRGGLTISEIARLKNTWPTNIRTKLSKFGFLDALALDERSLLNLGCSVSQYEEVQGPPTSAFHSQKCRASKRGIGWELNFWQWWTIWQESGRWDERGRGAEAFAMCRFGDTGPYAVGNVYIATNNQNWQDYWNTSGRRVSEARA